MRRKNKENESPKNNSVTTSKYKKKLSLKFKIFAYLAALCIFTISLLWVFQIIFLDEFYYHVTINSLSSAADGYVGMSEEEIQTYTDGIASEENISVIVYSSKAEQLAASSEHPNSIIGHFSSDMISDIYEKTKANGGTYSYTLDFSDIAVGDQGVGNTDKPTLPTDTEAFPSIPDGFPSPNSDQSHSGETDEFTQKKQKAESSIVRLVYSRITSSESGTDYLILFDCSLTPVDTVSETIKIQLFIISILCIAFSLAVALLFSHKVSKPISKINDSAKQLAKGKYDVAFEGGGCREIDELSETLSYACTELSKLEKLQNELISNISHDLRTPLTMINGYAEVMRDIPGENTSENVQVIIDETKRLSSLVNNLLEVSKAQKDARVLNCQVFCITELLRETVARFEKLNECKGYTFMLDAKEDAFVFADKEKISQVLYNLIGNAVNYTGEDKQVFVSQTNAESVVRIDIYDTGDGIEAEKLPHIWQRYYRADAYHKRSELGMGIGLSIVKDILDAHNAAFGVSSKIGHGSDFWFKLHTVDEKSIKVQ